jgi:hypothetical protein
LRTSSKWTFSSTLIPKRNLIKVSDSVSFSLYTVDFCNNLKWAKKFPLHRIIHWCWETEFELDQRKKKKTEIDLLINSQQMVLSVILHAGAVPLSLEDQVHYYPSSSTTFQSSTIFQSSSPASPEYVQHQQRRRCNRNENYSFLQKMILFFSKL